jgi:hypothetical protein
MERLTSRQPATFSTEWDGKTSATAKTTLHVITVAVSDYPADSGYQRLPYAEASAREFATLFDPRKAGRNGLYAHVRIWEGLFGPKADREGVRRRLAEVVSTAGEDDVVLLYLAGHGAVPEEREMFYWIPFDGRGDNEGELRRTGLSTALLAEWLRGLRARRVLLVLDACQSGGAVEALRKIGEIKARIEQHRQQQHPLPAARFIRGVGIYLVAATMPLSYAVQLPTQGHSILLEAFGAAIHQDHGIPSVRDLVNRLRDQVPNISEKLIPGFRQVPLVNSIGLDFPLLLPAASPAE